MLTSNVIAFIVLFVGVNVWMLLFYGKYPRNFVFLFLAFFSVVLLSFCAFRLGQNVIYSELAQGVAQDQISAKEEYSAIAQVEIIYRTGKLAEVVLVKGTTKSKLKE